MLSTVSNAITGMVHSAQFDPLYWSPEEFKGRYDKEMTEAQAELSIDVQARNDGVNNKPPVNATGLSQIETAIRDRCQQALNREIDKLDQELIHYNQEVREQKVSLGEQTFKQLFEVTPDKLASEANGSLDQEFKQLLSDHDQQQREFAAFKSEHRLNRSARYPDNRFWGFFIVALIWVGESVGNSYFFGKGSELGLLGGFMEAAFFALINIALAFAVAGSLRRLGHVYIGTRILGVLSLIVSFGLMVLMLVVAALYRFQLSESDSINQGLTSIVTSLPWGKIGESLSSKDGVLLVVLGLILGVIAIVDFYLLDDKYAHYGAEARRLATLKETIQYASKIEKDKVIDQYLGEAKLKELKKFESDIARVLTRLENSIKVTTGFEQSVVNQLESSYHQLLKKYREVNIRVRTGEGDVLGTKDLPPYFSDYPPLSREKNKFTEKARGLEVEKAAFEQLLAKFNEAKSGLKDREPALREKCEQIWEEVIEKMTLRAREKNEAENKRNV